MTISSPIGCLALAGAKYSSSELDLSHAKVGIIISGGNVDMDKFASYLKQS
jgi:threonine dehydratase